MILESKPFLFVKEVFYDFLADALYRLIIGTGYWGTKRTDPPSRAIHYLATNNKSLWVCHNYDAPGFGIGVVIKSVRWAKPFNSLLRSMSDGIIKKAITFPIAMKIKTKITDQVCKILTDLWMRLAWITGLKDAMGHDPFGLVHRNAHIVMVMLPDYAWHDEDGRPRHGTFRRPSWY